MREGRSFRFNDGAQIIIKTSQQMSQTSRQEGVRDGFIKFNKCPKPRGRGVCAKVFLSSTNVPNLLVGGVREGRSYRFNDGVHVIKNRLSKCPNPRGRRVCAKVFLSSRNVPYLVVGGCARRFY